MKIVLATRNQGKVKELIAILKPLGAELVAQDELDIESPEETGKTFIENAFSIVFDYTFCYRISRSFMVEQKYRFLFSIC